MLVGLLTWEAKAASLATGSMLRGATGADAMIMNEEAAAPETHDGREDWTISASGQAIPGPPEAGLANGQRTHAANSNLIWGSELEEDWGVSEFMWARHEIEKMSFEDLADAGLFESYDFSYDMATPGDVVFQKMSDEEDFLLPHDLGMPTGLMGIRNDLWGKSMEGEFSLSFMFI